MKKLKSLLLASLMLSVSVGAWAQLTGGVVEEHNTGDFTYQKNKKRSAPGVARSVQLYGSATERPDHLNNALLKYFPPIFSQDQGSCDAAAYIGYQWTYERNSYYGLDGSEDENRFTSHFNYLHTHSYQGTGKAEMLQEVGNPSVADYGGQTYSKFFGNQTCFDPDYGWMQGYNKWYNTMHNRDWTTSNIEASMMTEEGREQLKQWLWNHNGDNDFYAGGVAWFGMAALDISCGPIPDTPANREAGVVGKQYIGEWGPTYNHAQTIVGYDDRIEFDLDSNGVYGEKDKDEVGAWIIANSWGNGWLNNGFVYCPYARSVTTSSRRSSWTVTRHFIRKDYEPLRTIKIKLAYSKRSMLALSVTATQDTASDLSTDSLPMHHFQYAGDGTRTKDDPPSTPMLGRWVDGLHYEPMEFGYDVTSLTQLFDRRKPIKYFFNILTRDIDADKAGTGRLYSASIIDYELDKDGVEFPFKVENVQITEAGKLYRVSVIVPGEQINPPTNLTINNGVLSWGAPSTTSLTIQKYYIYNDASLIDSVSNSTFSYTPDFESDKAFGIAAVYDYRGSSVLSDLSNLVIIPTESSSTDNYVLSMSDAMATVSNVGFKLSSSASLEYWIKPHSFQNYSAQIGNPIYFLTAHTLNRRTRAGWGKTVMYSGAAATVLTEGVWNHVAISFNNKAITYFLNGDSVYTTKINRADGSIRAFDDFYIGREMDNGLIDAEIDEIRLWNRALSPDEVARNYRSEIANPSNQDSLVLYFKGDIFDNDGIPCIRDYARGHHAVINTPDSVSSIVDNSFLNDSTSLYASILAPTETIYATTPIRLSSLVSSSAKSLQWTIDDDATVLGQANSVYLTFATAGTHTVHLSATSSSGETVSTQLEVNVQQLPLPIANFEVTADNLPASESFSFVNRSTGINCTYKWSMPGADQEEVSATNATARFLNVGTYPVTLTVTNSSGSSSITKEVTAIASAPYVDFDVNPSAILLGDKVFFEDRSIYDPEKWQWEVNHVSGKRNYVILAQHTAFTPEAPGYYNVTLKASNAQGETGKTINKIFAVSNADPGNGLTVGGSSTGGRFTLSSPVTSSTRYFTIDTWLYPISTTGALTMATDDGNFKTWANADGSIGVYVNGKQVTSDAGYIITGEWHHYAITYSTGSVKFYRDAELISSPSLRLGLNCPAWTGSLTVCSDTAAFNGKFDEFRIWTKALNQNQIRSFCNQPIPEEDIPTCVADNGLKVYYQFNQNSGDILDSSGNGFTATRLNFGPDGDAWSSALGVFTLDFEGDEASDVTADYLTNYKAPFLYNDTTVSTTNSANLLQLKTGTTDSKWQISNAIVTDQATTGAHVAKAQNYDINFRTGYYGFADTLTNHLLYQTVVLPAGYYTLTVSPSEQGTFDSDSSLICIVRGDEFVDRSNYETQSIAYTSLSNRSVTFTVGEEQEITLGLIVNLYGWTAIDIAEFNLMRTPIKTVAPEDVTSVYDAVDNSTMRRYTPMSHAIRVINREPRQMKVYTLDGRLVFNQLVEGVHIIPFQPGTYIVDGEKIQVGN